MRVVNIEIADVDYDGESQCFEGHVVLRIAQPDRARTVDLHFICHADQPQGCPASIVTYSLISDALRQARRMPGFRRGEEEIVVVAPAPQIAALGALA